MAFFDSLLNLITGLGTNKDPTTATQVALNLLNQKQLETLYRSDWLARAIVDDPAEDMTREWRAWQGSAEQIGAVEGLERKLEIQKKLRSALIKARLYGGAALVMGVRQGQPEDELNFDAIGKDDLQFVVALHRWELSPGERIYDVTSRWYTRPSYYMISTPLYGFDLNGARAMERDFGQYSAMPHPGQPVNAPGSETAKAGLATTVRVHPSRVIEFVGNEIPDWRNAENGAWGDSVLQTVNDSLMAYGMALGGLAGMANDMKVDYFKVPNLSRSLADKTASAKLIERMSLISTGKSIFNGVLMDKEEEWERISTSFTGAEGVIRLLLMIACASGRVPQSRIAGSAPAKGLASEGGSGGDIDIKNYFDSMASEQKTRTTPNMEPLDHCLNASALGAYNDKVRFDWNPLYQPDPAQVAAIALQKAQATTAYKTSGLFNDDLLREVVSNQLIEDGTYPGWEDAEETYGLAPELPEPPPSPPDGFLPAGAFEPNPFDLQREQAKLAPPKKPGETK